MLVESCKSYIVDLTVSLGNISYKAYQKESLKFFGNEATNQALIMDTVFSYLTHKSRLGFSVSTKTLRKLLSKYDTFLKA